MNLQHDHVLLCISFTKLKRQYKCGNLSFLGGVFEADSKVRDKLRALDPPAPDYSTPGHDLAPDYWAEHLTPPYFEKKVYGSAKQPHTPAAVSLEWSIPSPPDFHHFHQVPRLVVAPSEEKTVAKSH